MPQTKLMRQAYTPYVSEDTISCEDCKWYSVCFKSKLIDKTQLSIVLDIKSVLNKKLLLIPD